MFRILAIEDSIEVQLVLKRTLGIQHELVFKTTIEQGRDELSSSQFDALILDIGLPDGDGLRFCSELKASERHRDLPIFILTSKTSLHEETLGFQLGIEDFIKKPFEPTALKVRIESRLGKLLQKKETKDSVSVGNITVNFSDQRAFVGSASNQKRVEFSSTEFKILGYLMRNQGQVKSREQILSSVWGHGFHLSDRTIDSHICRIRKKLNSSNCQIEAIPQSGYRLSKKQIDKAAA